MLEEWRVGVVGVWRCLGFLQLIAGRRLTRGGTHFSPPCGLCAKVDIFQPSIATGGRKSVRSGLGQEGIRQEAPHVKRGSDSREARYLSLLGWQV